MGFLGFVEICPVVELFLTGSHTTCATTPAGHESNFTRFPFTWPLSSRREVEIRGISKLKLLEAPEMPISSEKPFRQTQGMFMEPCLTMPCCVWSIPPL